ncbi:M48 family metallopeptidase [Paucibacter sp. JuS9]|uniref:M48 family metallopeptidase n=1 Tax=Paucibacter sp. JuS9 TaxID=3228748 RepID=UPI003757C32D
MPEVRDVKYSVARSNRRTVAIFIERDGTVTVKAPTRASDQQLQRLVERKLPWIYRTLAQWGELNRAPIGKEYVSGETFYFLGQPCRLDISSEGDEPLSLVGDRFLLQPEHRAKADEMLRAFYRRAGYARLPSLIADHSQSMGVKPGKLRVWELNHRWASCSAAGNLNFHWRAMAAPLDVLHYLVVHELAHLKERNHTAEFWNIVSTELPAWRESAEWLKVHGARMTL